MADLTLRRRADQHAPVPDKPHGSDETEVQRYLAAGAAHGARTTAHPAMSCIPVILAVVVAAFILRFIGSNSMQPKVWTSEELAKHDGSHGRRPVLLGILGSVFDVSKGLEHYGPGAPYHHFVGRDASRAFVSGNFSGDGLTDSLEGLSPEQVKSIDEWRGFYLKNYQYAGKLVGTYYDSQGKPTRALVEAERQAALGREIVKKQEDEEKLFHSCNSRASASNSEVWCSSGFPRKVERVQHGPYKGPPVKRCGCFQADELNRPDLELYEGCDAYATTCKVS